MANQLDQEISYRWPYGWSLNEEHVPESKGPHVNLLLKAIIEHNIPEMESLFRRGATLSGLHRESFQRVLYHVLNDYPLMRCLVDHGFTRKVCLNTTDRSIVSQCLSDRWDTYGLLGRAYSMHVPKVFALLAENGFDDCWYPVGQGNAIQTMLKRGDILSVTVLLRNGFPKYNITNYQKDYPHSAVFVELDRAGFIHRTGFSLDPERFSVIPKPQLRKVPLLFGRAEALRENQRLMDDYQDRVHAQQAFKAQFPPKVWQCIVLQAARERKESDEAMSRVLDSLKDGSFWKD